MFTLCFISVCQVTCHGYINKHKSHFIGSLRLTLKIEKLPPLNQGYPEMKCPFFLHHNCCEKNSVKWYVACHGYVYNHQSYIEKLPKEIEKNDPFNRKKWNFPKKIKSLQFPMVL